MRAICSICADNLILSEHISGTHCGHVFHNHCLEKWFSTSGHQTCPTCRGRLPRSKIVQRLYFDQGDTSDESADVGALENKVADLGVKVSDLQKQRKTLVAELSTSKQELEQTGALLKVKECNIRELKETLRRVRDDLKVTEQYRAEQLKDRQRADSAEQELKKYQRLQSIIQGSETDVKQLLSGLGSSQASSRHLAEYCITLKTRNDTLLEKRRALTKQLSESTRRSRQAKELQEQAEQDCQRIKLSLNSKQQELDSAHRERVSLQKRLAALEKAISSPSSTGSSLHRILHESPMPLLPHTPSTPSINTNISSKRDLNTSSIDLFDTDDENSCTLSTSKSKSSKPKITASTANKLVASSPNDIPVARLLKPQKKSDDIVWGLPLMQRKRRLADPGAAGPIIRKDYDGMGGVELFTRASNTFNLPKRPKKKQSSLNPFKLASTPALPSLDDTDL